MPKQRNKELIQSYSPRYQLMENPSLAPNLFPDYMFPDLPFTSPYCYQYSFSLPEEIPQDSSVYPRAIASIKKTLR